jgi:hypothetical protein
MKEALEKGADLDSTFIFSKDSALHFAASCSDGCRSLAPRTGYEKDCRGLTEEQMASLYENDCTRDAAYNIYYRGEEDHPHNINAFQNIRMDNDRRNKFFESVWQLLESPWLVS